jgi:hypothetical protein
MDTINDIFYNAARDNEQLLELIATETDNKMKLVWEYHRFLNYEIMANVLNQKYDTALKNVQEMKRSIQVTEQYLKQ